MDNSPPSPLLQPLHDGAGMDLQLPMPDDSSTPLWDLGDLLDLAADDQFSFSLEQDNLPSASSHYLEIQSQTSPPSNSDRIRKRDPRLTCSNFLAGRVPCACPEIDAMLEEEAAATPGKKRARTARATAGTVRCQVPGCEVDISELKGYHRRHRVCLRCANAAAVVLDGETKRYCQQCGKFHVLSDFDEGKRSCRRKLERHNNRRRRKPVDSAASMESDRSGVPLEDVSCNGDVGKDNILFNNQTDQKEVVHLEPEHGLVTSTVCSAPDLQNNMDGRLTLLAMGEAQVDGGKDNSKSLTSSYCDNKSTYSSMCPTGRISFKLYDWNPAEFPRRLRLQIFEWLANMPVELEGYIRPGCIILTAFVAMPKFMWIKLLEDPTTHVHNFVVARGRPLWGRGNMLVYLNNMIFRPVEGKSVMKIERDMQAPRLHYIHPTCFEAGKPMEFVACGSHLRQPKFRSLVSFAGKYLSHDHSFVLSHCQKEGDDAKWSDHQLFKIYIPHTDHDLFGPAFVEVENHSGLSNFIPILIGDSETCSEMKTIQERLDMSLLVEATGSSHESCEHSSLRQKVHSELMMDISWLLKKPSSEHVQHIMNSSQIQRFTRLLKFLIRNDSTVILGRVLEHLKIVMENVESDVAVNGFSYPDLRFFEKYLDSARDVLQLNLHKTGNSVLHLGHPKSKGDRVSQSCSENKLVSVVPGIVLKMESRENGHFRTVAGSTSIGSVETVPLLNKNLGEKITVRAFTVKEESRKQEHSRKSCGLLFSGAHFRRQTTLFAVTFVAVCFGICAALVHSHKVGDFAVSIRRCLINKL
ncbi:squamosa promoter-binding-like protein 7 [Cucurbita moschata]|uniref:Squamosa promoter-binding-like protein 7 n=1 Tax=Cucurbita moschata TaxID=3662 RepID=A0A6J1GV29_CUCMO|nr:squamosa promoter-binding-like protein 7 [Cucurbita moschata]